MNCRFFQFLVLTVVLGTLLLGACGPATTSGDDARVSDAAGVAGGRAGVFVSLKVATAQEAAQILTFAIIIPPVLL